MTSAPRHALHRMSVLLVAALASFAVSLPASALRVVNYNILNYPGNSGPARAGYYRTILGPVAPDVIVTEEMNNFGAPLEFLNEVLNVMEPGQWATVQFIDGNDTDSSLFYKPAKVQFIGQWAFYPNPANLLRLVHVYRLKPVGYSAQASELRLYSTHLKASTGFESQRLAECTGIRDSLNAMPPGTHAMLCGDLNFYNQASEPGYARLLESQSNNTGRLYDLLPAGAWHDNAAFSHYHTQSTCLSGGCASGAATGGMDDRFDFILPTYNLGTGQGLGVLPNTCVAVGNDGLHLNHAISDLPVIPEGAAYASALQLSSDHLPVRVDLQLPAQLIVDSALAFDPVIVGAPLQSRDLLISNPAAAPADSLNCAFVPPAGFGAPGALAVAAGGSRLASITMNTTQVGLRAGDLRISSDAPDNPLATVHLSGTVLDHAVASLDSITVVRSSSIDFGDHQAGGFTEQTLRIHDAGYDPFQARLLVSAAVLAGATDRFTLVGGFNPVLIGEIGRSFTVAFNEDGAAVDSTYTATLTFVSADEPFPGALPQPDLVVSLRARLTQGQVDTPGVSTPLATRLYWPSPNPTTGSATMTLDLARSVEANLSVFDPAGRRVATLRHGTLSSGRHAVTWDGRTDLGAPVSSGTYFVRLTTPGDRMQVVRVTVIR